MTMEIRLAQESELEVIKRIIDSSEEMDADKETFSLNYLRRILKEGILLVTTKEEELIGVCFGKYNPKESWSDLLGIVVDKDFRQQGIASKLIEKFEAIVKEKQIQSIDLYSSINQKDFFKKKGYTEGKTYVAMRKKLE